MTKALYIDFNMIYISPTRNAVALLLKQIFELTYYGPGYTDETTLKKGLIDYVEKNGPYEFIITNEHIIYSKHRPCTIEAYNIAYKYFAKYFLIREALYAPKILEEFLKLKTPKIVVLFESDFYNMQLRTLQVIKETDAYLLAMGEQFFKPYISYKYLHLEKFKNEVNDNWLEFSEQEKHRIISLPQFLSESEFSFNPLNNRKYDWAVPGTAYWARKEAAKLLMDHHMDMLAFRPQRVLALLEKMGFKPYTNSVLLKILNFQFQEQLKQSKYIFTCGSAIRLPIRKFFEIPGAGAVLICIPCNGFEEMGFTDGVNSIIASPENIIEVNDFLNKNPNKAQKIANQGRELIWNKHSATARINQILQCLSAIKENKFNGSSWIAGEFKVNYK